MVVNFDPILGWRIEGPMTEETAFLEALNSPTVRTLLLIELKDGNLSPTLTTLIELLMEKAMEDENTPENPG